MIGFKIGFTVFSFLAFSSQVTGAHLNMYTPPGTMWTHIRLALGLLLPSFSYKDSEYRAVVSAGSLFTKALRETGYLHIQATKPDTIGISNVLVCQCHRHVKRSSRATITFIAVLHVEVYLIFKLFLPESLIYRESSNGIMSK